MGEFCVGCGFAMDPSDLELRENPPSATHIPSPTLAPPNAVKHRDDHWSRQTRRDRFHDRLFDRREQMRILARGGQMALEVWVMSRRTSSGDSGWTPPRHHPHRSCSWQQLDAWSSPSAKKYSSKQSTDPSRQKTTRCSFIPSPPASHCTFLLCPHPPVPENRAIVTWRIRDSKAPACTATIRGLIVGRLRTPQL